MKTLFGSKVVLVFILLIMTAVSSNLNWGKNNWQGTIAADGKGYYAYLPAIFIYHDLNFGFFDAIEKEKYYNPNHFYDYRIGAPNGKVIDKYYCGTALAQLPFFLVAHYLSVSMGHDADGHSKPYHIAVNVAALFYLLIGLIFVRRILIDYKVKDGFISLALTVATFGTNLFCYTAIEPGMSHIYSFGLVSMFLYYGTRYFKKNSPFLLISMAALLGMVVLIRPVNALIFFALPFIAVDFRKFRKGVAFAFRRIKYLGLAIIIFAAIVSIQLIIYKISADQFFIYAYQNEGFNFSSPHVFDILFSYRKGLFLYTPIYLMSMAGCYFIWKKSKFQTFAFLGFFALITYVLSCWWMWYYGGSFSSRVYVEYIPFFVLLLGVALNGFKKGNVRTAYITAIVLLTIVCQIQTYQYRYYHIHWSEMNKEKYWDVFLRVDRI